MTSTFTPQSPETQETEPTVLDLFKSVTRDWRSFFTFLGSIISEERRLEVERAAVVEAQHGTVLVEPQSAEISLPVSAVFPWRSLSAILLALFAQLMLEPPGVRAELAVALYVFAVGLALWSFLAGEWRMPSLREDSAATDPMTVRIIPLLLSAVLSVIAFLALGDDLFTWGNLAVWLAAIGCFVWALWLRGPRRARLPMVPAARRKAMLWAALLLAVFGLALFFRFNRLGEVPSEPFSDHAEKILDVYEITLGKTLIFFTRNTGREAFQMYWTLLIAKIFGTGLSFLSLKLGTALLGVLTLPYIYLLGKELGSPRLGIFALFLFGVSYWLNVTARIGLRFPLYPLFAAPVLYHLLRGLRMRTRNDFLLAGLFLGVGLHGYSPYRIVPILVVVGFIIYLLHPASKDVRKEAVWWLGLVAVLSLIVFLPLLRYSVDHPDTFNYRAISRLGTVETALPGPPAQIFFSNLWNGLRMFNWDDGEIWVNSVPHRPALDTLTGALFLIGAALLLARYIRRRDWRDLFLLVSIPVLLMPSVLSLAYPGENPALNRAGGAAIPVLLIAALALDGLVEALGSGGKRRVLAWGLTGLLLAAAAYQNYDLVLHEFDAQFRNGAWNTSEMGKVISEFRDEHGETDTVWIVPYPYWVDTRLPGIWAGIPNRDFALFKEDLGRSVSAPFPKLFMFRPEDTETENLLRQLYPRGVLSRYTSAVNSSKDFMIFLVEE